ncbi:uncharacterized protein LOC141626588 [Silene latifolia]|uniref:uncharacterized protein LOC141626588 n=1 Tax=Silene latifolia TaxID=37657 RepID=UPI003D7799E5
MIGIKYLSDRAHKYLDDIGASHWSRHAFNTSCKSNMLTNNMCESFNSVLREVRDKPVLTMMEWMRRYVMKRHYEKREGVKKYEGKVMPYVEEFLNWAKKESSCCDVWASSDDSFEVEYMSKQYVVDLQSQRCSCCHWQLSGLPCQHAIAAIHHQRANYEDYVHEAYTKEKYMTAYRSPIPPMPGISQWERVGLNEPLPPPYRKLPGRPSMKKRRKEAGEGGSTEHPKRQKHQRSCGKCGELGHNVKSCKNPAKETFKQTRPTSEWTKKVRAVTDKRKAKKQHDAEVIQFIATGSQPQSTQESNAPNNHTRSSTQGTQQQDGGRTNRRRRALAFDGSSNRQ